jgi:hypothetical protein
MSTLLGNDAIQWAALTGIVLPPLAAIVQKEEWRRGDDHFNSLMNAMIFGGCCIGAAFVVAYLDQNGWNWDNWRQTLVTIVFAGIGMYKLYWKPSKAVSACRAAGPISSAPLDSTAVPAPAPSS